MTEYDVVLLGLTVIEFPDSPPGFHENTPPGIFELAVKVALCPAQMLALVAVMVGTGNTVTVPVAASAVQPAFVL